MSKKDEGYKNLKMDTSFFARMLRRDNKAPPEYRDFDVYLMEKSLMPLLLQALDALSRHIDRMHSKKNGMDSESRSRFNPLVWLAQYLLRNHPRHLRDHRTPMYHDFSDWALIEKGRREIFRRKPQIEDAYHRQEKQVENNQLLLLHLPEFVGALDEMWALRGALTEKMPKVFQAVGHGGNIKTQDGTPGGVVLFEDWWKWFEVHVEGNDVLRASDFEEAALRKREEERRLKRLQDEQERKEQRALAMLEKRTELIQQFEAIMADIYLDDEMGKILHSGASLNGVEDEEGGVPVHGSHIEMIKKMMGLWGAGINMDSEPDHWNDSALAAWKDWLQRHPSPDGAEALNSTNLRNLTDLDSYKTWLLRAYPSEELADDENERCMEIKKFIDDEDNMEYLADVLDDETGEELQVSLPDEVAEEVRQRLEKNEIVFAKVDVSNNCITVVLPAEEDAEPGAEGEGESPMLSDNGSGLGA